MKKATQYGQINKLGSKMCIEVGPWLLNFVPYDIVRNDFNRQHIKKEH